MWSADQQLGPGVGHWHPHMMVFAPYYDNAMLGGNEVGVVPVVNDDAGTPFTVIVIPVDGKLAIAREDVVTARVPVPMQGARRHGRDVTLVDRCRLGRAVGPPDDVAVPDHGRPP
jgi:hypothetical protein